MKRNSNLKNNLDLMPDQDFDANFNKAFKMMTRFASVFMVVWVIFILSAVGGIVGLLIWLFKYCL